MPGAAVVDNDVKRHLMVKSRAFGYRLYRRTVLVMRVGVEPHRHRPRSRIVAEAAGLDLFSEYREGEPHEPPSVRPDDPPDESPAFQRCGVAVPRVRDRQIQ